MRRWFGDYRVGLCALGVGLGLAAVCAPAATAATGKQSFSGYIGAIGTQTDRKVVGSVVVAKGVYDGVGTVVERPNRPGDSGRVTRDDLVFPDGVIHIVSTQRHFAISPDRQSCAFTAEVEQTTRFDGGTGKFAHATGSFMGRVMGTALGHRTPAGACDQKHSPLFELDRFTASGTMTL
jgi:hypothetical protein